MDLQKFREILKRYEQNASNETEDALVEAWYRSYEDQEEKLSGKDLDNLRDPLFRKIKSATQKRSVYRLPVFQMAAALAVFAITGLAMWYYSRTPSNTNLVTVITGANALRQISLPDGSAVWLNAASRLKTPVEFSGGNREVFLEEGEAFFKVKKDRKHPFIVHTSRLNVQVLGTSFNIKAYKALQFIRVTVTTGKVAVTKGKNVLAMLTPGQQLKYDLLSGAVDLSQTSAEEAQGWKNGATFLSDATFSELAYSVKQIYGLSIKARNQKIQAYHFSMKLINTLPPQQVIELIGQLHQTPFKKEGNDIVFY